MLGTWGVDIEESNNFILIYIVIFMMTYAVANVSYEDISKITSENWSHDFIRELSFYSFRHSSWFMNWL